MRKNIIILFLSLVFFINPSFLLCSDTDIKTVQLSLPDKTWSLDINLPDFKIEKASFNKDATGRMLYAINPRTGIIISIFLEKAAFAGNNKVCREYYWARAQKSPFQKDDIKFSEAGNMALVEYITKMHQGTVVNQKNVNAYMSKDDVWIDIHLSKANFKPHEEELFKTILNTVRFNENYVPNQQECLRFGSMFYLQRNYQKAIRYYEKALEFEKKVPRLDRDTKRVLIDNLGMAYGISGNLKRAKEIFEYGIAGDQTYPMYYYNLACAYAEMNDLDNAIVNLQTAFKYKQNMIKGERMPDHRTDSSFAKYMENKRFLKILEMLNQ